MSHVTSFLLCPQENESDGQVYSHKKTPLVRLDGTGSLLSEVLGDMMHPRRSVSLHNDFLNDVQVVCRDGLWVWSIVGVLVWLG
jgi:hypothetical protein